MALLTNILIALKWYPSTDDIVSYSNMAAALKMSNLIKIVNLEDGLPSVEQARVRLNTELNIARKSGVRVLKIIHGYGSSGVGGDLRIALQATLRQMANRGEVHACIYGEDWSKADESAWTLLKQSPELKADRDLGKGNRGITLVVL